MSSFLIPERFEVVGRGMHRSKPGQNYLQCSCGRQTSLFIEMPKYIIRTVSERLCFNLKIRKTQVSPFEKNSISIYKHLKILFRTALHNIQMCRYFIQALVDRHQITLNCYKNVRMDNLGLCKFTDNHTYKIISQSQKPCSFHCSMLPLASKKQLVARFRELHLLYSKALPNI